MKSFPSDSILRDPLKSNAIERVLNDLQLNQITYASMLYESVIKDKHILTALGREILLLPEHKGLLEHLKRKYPDRNLDRMFIF